MSEGVRISMEKTVTPTKGGWLEVLIQLINESKATVPEIPFTDLVPKAFEVDKRSISPQPEMIEDISEGTLIRWKLELNPEEKKILSYRVKAKTPDADISELLRAHGG